MGLVYIYIYIKYLQEYIVFQVLIAKKPCNFISLYPPSSQPNYPNYIFDQFADNLELTIDEVAKTAQKMKFSIKDFFSKCDKIRNFLALLIFLINIKMTYPTI